MLNLVVIKTFPPKADQPGTEKHKNIKTTFVMSFFIKTKKSPSIR